MEGADKGFEFCTGGLNPLAYNKKLNQAIIPETLTGTTTELAAVVEKYLDDQDTYKKHVVGGLSEAGLAFGDPVLFEDLRQMVNKILNRPIAGAFNVPSLKISYRQDLALGKLKYLVEDPETKPPDPNATRFDLKNEFYRTPQFIAAALSMWYGLDAITTDDQINQLAQKGYISPENARNLTKAMEKPILLRFKTHSKAGEEWEGVRAKDHKYAKKELNPASLSSMSEEQKKKTVDHAEKTNRMLPHMEKKDIELTPKDLSELRDAANEVRKLWKLAESFYNMHKPGFGGIRINPFMRPVVRR